MNLNANQCPCGGKSGSKSSTPPQSHYGSEPGTRGRSPSRLGSDTIQRHPFAQKPMR
ncbi:hypothetical protein HNI00_17620 [Thermoleptolyngbya oregonensis NK1-22]|uniref:Uncharacterized protein n=1 Tax=Thermoleptolyngbya oregonensis NK1-22 TaxID=2547457 RepID=A0AA96Y708_9CYAN|nr:hypothetical protein [Thermoleptolyngbya oregonensis]WOB44766.1 hypothetical protein HNI00_17620 [Thermoleptolyngbya oregonensis NK1-22]